MVRRKKMKNFYKINTVIGCLLLIGSLFLMSCDDFTASQRYKHNEFFISGLIHFGTFIDHEHPIFIGKTISPFDGNWQDIPESGADVKIYEYSDLSTLKDSVSLTFSWEIVGYYDVENYLKIKENHFYKIEAKIGNELIWAETNIPPIIEIETSETAFTDSLSENLPQIVYETANQKNPIEIRSYLPETENTYVLKVRLYCLEDFSFGYPEYTNKYSNSGPEKENEYEDPMTGFPRKVEYFQEYEPTKIHGEQYSVVMDSQYSGGIIFFGDYSLTYSSISDNYYKYLYKPEGYKHGGIHNGYGYFGATADKTIYAKFVSE